MKSSFLDYYKIVLDRVSFDPELFTKEYHKSLKTLEAREVQTLNQWLLSRGLPKDFDENLVSSHLMESSIDRENRY